LLVKRIIRSNPGILQNPDYKDKSNSSLHLAAQTGSVEIVVRTCFRRIQRPSNRHTRAKTNTLFSRNFLSTTDMTTPRYHVTPTGTHR
jgi:hypothetical protein